MVIRAAAIRLALAGMVGTVSSYAIELPFTPPEQQQPAPEAHLRDCVSDNLRYFVEYSQTKQYPQACYDSWRAPLAAHAYEDKVYGYVYANVDASGKATARALFSNGKKFQGEEGLGVIVRFNRPDGTAYSLGLRATVRGAEFHNGSREVWVEQSLTLPPQEWGAVSSVTAEWIRIHNGRPIPGLYGPTSGS